MFIPISGMVVLCLSNILIGFVISFIGGRFLLRNRRTAAATLITPDLAQLAGHDEMDRQLSSLFELASHVGNQVEKHNLSVGEITGSMELKNEGQTPLALVAGKLLITANQKLQSDLEEAKQQIRIQREQMTCYLQESRTDILTGLPNRRALDQEMIRAFAQYQRHGTVFSILMIDIDHFKRVNDKYGHMVGDRLLKNFAQCLTDISREADFIARYGGEEFVAILPKTSILEACNAMERVRSAIAASRYKVGDLELQITASIGAKEVMGDETEKELFEKADEALYAAKEAGRNCCYFHDGIMCKSFAPVAAPVGLNSESMTSTSPDIGVNSATAMKISQSSQPRKKSFSGHT